MNFGHDMEMSEWKKLSRSRKGTLYLFTLNDPSLFNARKDEAFVPKPKSLNCSFFSFAMILQIAKFDTLKLQLKISDLSI